MRNDAKTNDAAAYTARLTQKVQEAIDDPRPSVPHAQVATEWKLERAALTVIADRKRITAHIARSTHEQQ